MSKEHVEFNYALYIIRNLKRNQGTLEKLSSGVITCNFFRLFYPFSFNINARNRFIINNIAPR